MFKHSSIQITKTNVSCFKKFPVMETTLFNFKSFTLASFHEPPGFLSSFHVVSCLTIPGFHSSYHVVSTLATPFPVVFTRIPVRKPQVSNGFHGVSCQETPGFQWFPRVFLLKTQGFQWFPRRFLSGNPGFQLFPRGFLLETPGFQFTQGSMSGIWAVSAFNGMEKLETKGFRWGN